MAKIGRIGLIMAAQQGTKGPKEPKIDTPPDVTPSGGPPQDEIAIVRGALKALDEGRAFPYQKIFIATAGVSELSQEDLRVVTNELRSRRKNGPFGEVAVVAGTSRNKALADIFRMLSRVDRPLFICATIHDARQWLARRRASTPVR